MSRKDWNFKGFFRPKLGDLQKKEKKKKKRSSPKFRVFFRPKSKIQTFFPKLGDLQKKKKKKKKVFAKIQSDFSAEIQNSNVFSAQNQVISKKKKKKKKKKRSSPIFRAIFLPISQVQTYERMRGGSFRMGGAIFHFSQKIGLKSTKNMRFCILHKPMGGGSSPPRPPPGYATGYTRHRDNCKETNNPKVPK